MQQLSRHEVIRDRYDGQVAMIGRRFAVYPDLRATLDALSAHGTRMAGCGRDPGRTALPRTVLPGTSQDRPDSRCT